MPLYCNSHHFPHTQSGLVSIHIISGFSTNPLTFSVGFQPPIRLNTLYHRTVGEVKFYDYTKLMCGCQVFDHRLSNFAHFDSFSTLIVYLGSRSNLEIVFVFSSDSTESLDFAHRQFF